MWQISIISLVIIQYINLCDCVTNATINGNCGRRPIDDNLLGRIVGGVATASGEVPWQGILKEKRLFGLYSYRKCGVVVIDEQWVLTAAHCVKTWFFSELVVILGHHDVLNLKKNETGAERKVKSVIVHPLFNSILLEDDLALLKLESSVEFDDTIQPICLPEKDQDFTGLNAYASGFGFTKYRKFIFSQSNCIKYQIMCLFYRSWFPSISSSSCQHTNHVESRMSRYVP